MYLYVSEARRHR